MTDILANLFGITLFLAVIAFSIGLHEWGHFTTAKRFGVKITEFMIGFGPTLFGRTSGETTYGVKAVPLGGYVRLVGMYPPAKDAQPGMVPDSSTGRFATLVSQAREASMVEIGPGDADRVFYKLPARKRVVVMMAGPFMNLVIAAVLFTIVLAGIGLPQATTTVREVVPCVPTVDNLFGDATTGGTCPAGSSASPASAADIRPGDVVVAVDGREVASWDQLSGTLAGVPAGSDVALTVDRSGARSTVNLAVATAVYPVLDEDGQPTGQTQTRSFVGIRPGAAYVPMAVTEVPPYMWDLTVRSVEAILSLPARLLELVQTLATDGERDPQGPVSVVGVTRIGGEIAALDEPLKAKTATFLGLAASLNLFLFLFNLLPLLPLDGGHAAAATYEGARKHVARWRDRPDPGPVDTARLLPVTYTVAVFMIAASVIVIWADIVKPISLTG